jgi:hypothetical protein
MKRTRLGSMQPAASRMGLAMLPLLLFSTLAIAQGGRYQSGDAWTFGATADTQWTITHSLTWDPIDPYYAHVNPNFREENPDYVSVSTALKLNDQFIAHGVRFVVQLGDLTDRAGNAAMHTHAQARQPLYDAGIGFFPVRGNHETYGALYGLDPDFDVNVPAWRDAFPQTQGQGANLFGAQNFNGPPDDALRGLSYSFDYGTPGSDARFVFMDIEPTHYRFAEPEPHPIYGEPYSYSNDFNWTVYRHTEDLIAREGNLILAGTWFRIASTGEPSTEFYGPAPGDGEILQPEEGQYTTSGTEFRPGDQQEWIDSRLQEPDRPVHAFVLAHRNLMGQNHRDTVWGSDPGVTPDVQNVFYRSLQENKVGYFLSAHDHMHHRAIVRSPDRNWFVEQLIASSSDPKFYTPAPGSMAGQRSRETPISQELNNIGYYIFTVDGSRLTVDYYSDRQGNFGTDYCWPDGYPGEGGTCSDPRRSAPAERIGSLYVPDFRFEKKETWGYGLNGKRFVIPQGGSYTGVTDEFAATRAAILRGTNGSAATDNIPGAPRPLSKTVTTGWAANPDPGKLKSDVLSLWGMAELGTEQTDVYVLSMSLGFNRMIHLGSGGIGIATYVDGQWVNAVDQNFGGSKRFVLGPYIEELHELGTYGIDPGSETAWAVLNYNADFAVADGVERVPGQRAR